MRSFEWAVGLFEGEGCITHHHSKRHDRTTDGKPAYYEYMSVKLTLSMTDEDVVMAFHETVGVGHVYRHHSPSRQHQKPQWRWHVQGSVAEELVWRMMPMLGIRRQEQFLQVKERIGDLVERREA